MKLLPSSIHESKRTMSSHLLASRRFLPLFITQFLGAFNDNVLKNALVMWITYKLTAQTDTQLLITLAAGLFILPFFLFSATAGQLADKYDRARLTRIIKWAEIFLMLIAAAGFYMGNVYFLLFVLFCVGVQATFFGPIKYALLPQHLHEKELISGNAYIEAGTFLAILLGTILGGLLIMQPQGDHWIALAMVLFALGGYMASRFIPSAPAPMPTLSIDFNIFRQTWKIIQYDRKNRRVFLSILAISWFWLVGATFLSQFPTYAKNVLGGDETVVTLLLTLFSIGIGLGSMACNRLLKGEVSSKYTPYACVGISLFTIDLFFASSLAPRSELLGAWAFLADSAHWRIIVDLLAIAICGGIFVVPLYAILQHDSDPQFRARTIASNNVINALFMVVAAVGTVAMLAANFTVPDVFLTIALLNSIAAYVVIKIRRPKH